MSAPVITEIKVKSVATVRHGFGVPGDVTINPYRGCAFSCKYCYSRKFIHDDPARRTTWGDWVEVKSNAVDALLRESHKLFDASVWIGSATDPYQPVERRVGLTRALLEVLLGAYPKRIHIQTRSPHVVRDIDLFQKFGDTLRVGISIPTDSEVVRRAFEPRAPSLARRIEAGRQLKEAGIQVSASIAPLLPCTPVRLARKLAGAFDSVWVGGINFYGDEGGARQVYTDHGWDKYLSLRHQVEVKAALRAAGLIREKEPLSE